MHTEILAVNAEHPEPEAIARAADVLRRGGLVAFPTETVYGLGADARNRAAVARIFTAKGRPAANPLIVHVARWEQALQLAAGWPDTAARLAERFWPGPLTLVLPGRGVLPETVTAGGPTVALRVPAHPVALALLRAAVLPIAAPSANRSSSVSATRAEHVLRGLDGRIDLLLDGGATAGGLESTVLDVTTTPPRLLRPGLVSPRDLEAVIGPIHRPDPKGAASAAPVLPSPGMLSRHYAPRAILECTSGDGGQRVAELVQQGLRVGWLTFDETESPNQPEVLALRMPRNPPAYAANLYAALHAFDDAGVERIVVALPPSGDDWLAVRDRLRRASSAS